MKLSRFFVFGSLLIAAGNLPGQTVPYGVSGEVRAFAYCGSFQKTDSVPNPIEVANLQFPTFTYSGGGCSVYERGSFNSGLTQSAGSATGTADYQSGVSHTITWTDTITISGSTSPVMLELIGVTAGPFTGGPRATLGYYDASIDGLGFPLIYVQPNTSSVRKSSVTASFDPTVPHTVAETTYFICAVFAETCSYNINSRFYIVPMQSGITITSTSGVSYALPK